MALLRTLNGGYESVKDDQGKESAGFSFAGLFGGRSTQPKAVDAPVVVRKTDASSDVAIRSTGQQHARLQSKEQPRETLYGTFKF
jgi:hypothetical protein